MSADEVPPATLSRAEKVRFFLLIALLFGVVGAMWAQRKEALEPLAAPAPPDAALPARDTAKAPAAGAPLTGMLDPDPVAPYAWNGSEALADAKDGSESLGPKALAYLLHTVRSTAADDKARSEAPCLTARELSAQSVARRGAWVRVIGVVGAGLYAPERVAWPGPTGVYQVYANFVFDGAGGAIKVYTLRDEPPVGNGDMVALSGLYLQTLSYRNGQNAAVSAPVVIGERLSRHEPPPRVTWLTAFALPGALGAAGIALVVMVVRTGRRAAVPPGTGVR
jgi:hypothetical protein